MHLAFKETLRWQKDETWLELTHRSCTRIIGDDVKSLASLSRM